MGKQPFIYSGKTAQGVSLEGTVHAASKEDAETMVRRMGAINPSIREFGSPEPPKSAPIPLVEAKQQNDVNSMIVGMAKSVNEQAKAQKEKKGIRQSLFIGEETKVKEQLEPILADQNGRIVQCQMNPNFHGTMIFMIVVEHDVLKGE